MTITPGNYDITIYQGCSFSQVFTWKDQNSAAINLTGYSGRMMAKTTADSSSAFISLTSPSGGITLGAAAGTITLTMSAAQTAALSVVNGVYDIELTDGSGNVIRLLQGNIFVSAEVTR